MAYLFGNNTSDTYRYNDNVVPASLKTLKILDGLTEIASYCFYNLSNLEAIELPTTITSIKEYAFKNCRALKNVSIPDAVTTMEKNAFDSCTGLETLMIGNGVTKIKENTFANCSSLQSVTIGSSVTDISNTAFGTRLYFNTLYWNATNYVYSGHYSDWIFKKIRAESITTIVIGDNVKNIPNYFAWGCTGLTSVVIGSNVSSIGDSAFRNCDALVSITYNGYSTNWSIIGKGENWKLNVPATYVLCKDTKILF